MPDSSVCVACLITTTTGKVLLRWEQDTALPFHFAQLSLLLSSLFYFAKGQEFAHIEMNNGYTIFVCSDAVAQVSVATICLTPSEGATSASLSPLAALEMMRLKSLVMLTAFVKAHFETIEAIVDESKREAETKASQYTLSNALGGGSSDETDENEDDQTHEAFLAFQHCVVERVMGLTSREAVDRFKPNMSGDDESAAALTLVHGFVMNTESGEFVYSTPIQPSQQRRMGHKSVKVQRMLKQAALALHQCFPVLCQTSLLHCKEDAGVVDVSFNTTLVLQFSKTMEAGGSPTAASSSAEDVLVALRMMPIGTFASGMFLYGKDPFFCGNQNELMRSGEFQRVLISDGRGSKLLQLIQEAAHARDYALHIGSDGLPNWAVKSLDSLTVLWTEVLDDEVVIPVQKGGLLYAQIPLGSSTRDLVAQTNTQDDLKVVSPRGPQSTS